MKKALFIIIPALVLFGIGIFLYKKKTGAEKLEFDVLEIKPKWISFTKGIQLDLKPVIKNFGDSDFTVNQLKVDVYTVSGVLITSQEKPITEAIVIKANQNNSFDMSYKIGISKIPILIADSGLPSGTKPMDVWNNYIDTGEFGLKVRLKGFANVDGIDIDFNEVVTF